MPAGLIALALGGFGIGLTEFVIMGLLPEVSASFAVSEVTAGWLISGYALAVVVGALALTAAVTRFPRKPVLMGLLLLFIAGNLLSAVAPSFGLMLGGRVIAALCHGAFFGIGAVVAADLVAPERRAQAIAIMFAGLTIANVLGVPFGTALGQELGWRSTFWAIAAIGVVALAGIAALIRLDEAGAVRPDLRTELGAFRSPQVLLSIGLTVLGFGGMFGAFTYIAYTLTDVAGFASGSVPLLLVVFGLGLFAGNLLGGRSADRNLEGTLGVVLAGLVLVLVGFALTTASSQALTVAFLFLMGAFGFATAPGFQMRIMRHAPQAPTMASSANIGAFNLGNALGAWLAGVAIGAGLGYTAPLWVGAGITASAIVLLGVATALERATAEPAAATPEDATATAGAKVPVA